MEKNGHKHFIQSSLSLTSAHYGSKAFKLMHWWKKSLSLARLLAPQHCFAVFRSAALQSSPLHTTPHHSARGLICEWESDDVLTRPHASIGANSTLSAAAGCKKTIRIPTDKDGKEKILGYRNKWRRQYGGGNEWASGALRSEWVSKQDY